MVSPFIHVVEVAEANGVVMALPILAGLSFLLERDGLPMLPAEYEILPEGGFQLKKTGDVLIAGQRFKITILGVVPVVSPMVTGVSGFRQYPHVATLIKAGESQQDEHGNWEASPSSTKTFPCRAEANGRGQDVVAASGERIQYSWNLFFPLPGPLSQPGEQLVVRDLNGEEIGRGRILRYLTKQYHARAWL